MLAPECFGNIPLLCVIANSMSVNILLVFCCSVSSDDAHDCDWSSCEEAIFQSAPNALFAYDILSLWFVCSEAS